MFRGALSFGNHLRVHQVQQHEIFTRIPLTCTSPDTIFLLALLVVLFCILEGHASIEVTSFFFNFLKLSRFSQWFKRQKRRITSDPFEWHQHISLSQTLISKQNEDGHIWYELYFWSTKTDNYGWLRTIWQNTVSNAQWSKRILPWTSVWATPGPPREGHKPELREQQWTSLVSLLLCVTWTLRTWLQGRDTKQHAKLNQWIPEQICQTGNLLSYQNAPVRICFWIQIQISPLLVQLVNNHTVQTTLLGKINIFQYRQEWGNYIHSAQERMLSTPFFPSSSSLSDMRNMGSGAGGSCPQSVRTLRCTCPSQHFHLHLKEYYDRPSSNSINFSAPDRGLFASLTLDNLSCLCVQ